MCVSRDYFSSAHSRPKIYVFELDYSVVADV